MIGTAEVIRADARSLPLEDESVDLIVTSPPYFALRSYTDGGEHYDGQIGSEATPAEFLEALWECTREWMRVLKPTGSLFVNLGDKYSGAQAQNVGGANRAGDSARTWAQTNPKNTGIPNKSLMGIPWRYALGCIDDLGLILRAEIVWSKPNGLPESVTDRVRRSHEQWFHLTKEGSYYSAVDAIREQYDGDRALSRRVKKPGDGKHDQRATWLDANPLGRLPGSVWDIATEPLKVPADLGVDHFAAFPTEWPRRIILGWPPSGICTECGEGRRLVVDAPTTGHDNNTDDRTGCNGIGLNGSDYYRHRAENPRIITGEACACDDPTAPTRPAVVLDPFGGTGTTALVAKALGRRGISVDLSADYCRLAEWRTNDPAQLAKAMRVEKPPVQADGQLDLLAVNA